MKAESERGVASCKGWREGGVWCEFCGGRRDNLKKGKEL